MAITGIIDSDVKGEPGEPYLGTCSFLDFKFKSLDKVYFIVNGVKLRGLVVHPIQKVDSQDYV